MRRLRLLVDVDGVLGDFQTPALDIMAEVTGRRYQPEDFEVWDIFSVLDDEHRGRRSLQRLRGLDSATT